MGLQQPRLCMPMQGWWALNTRRVPCQRHVDRTDGCNESSGFGLPSLRLNIGLSMGSFAVLICRQECFLGVPEASYHGAKTTALGQPALPRWPNAPRTTGQARACWEWCWMLRNPLLLEVAYPVPDTDDPKEHEAQYGDRAGGFWICQAMEAKCEYSCCTEHPSI